MFIIHYVYIYTYIKPVSDCLIVYRQYINSNNLASARACVNALCARVGNHRAIFKSRRIFSLRGNEGRPSALCLLPLLLLQVQMQYNYTTTTIMCSNIYTRIRIYYKTCGQCWIRTHTRTSYSPLHIIRTHVLEATFEVN